MVPKSVDQRSEFRTRLGGGLPPPTPSAGSLGGPIGSVLTVLGQNSEDWPPSLQKPCPPSQVLQRVRLGSFGIFGVSPRGFGAKPRGVAPTWLSPRGFRPKLRGQLQAVPRCGGQFSSSRTGPKSSRTGPKSSRTGPKWLQAAPRCAQVWDFGAKPRGLRVRKQPKLQIAVKVAVRVVASGAVTSGAALCPPGLAARFWGWASRFWYPGHNNQM